MDAYHAGYIYGMKDFQHHVYQSHNKVKKKDVDREHIALRYGQYSFLRASMLILSIKYTGILFE